MNYKKALCRLTMAVVLHLGLLAGSAQTGNYLFTGSKTNITLNPGAYIITAYGAPGDFVLGSYRGFYGGLGAEMSGEFNFSTTTTLTLLVGEGGGISSGYGYGGGGGSFVVKGRTPLVVAGGGGGNGGYGSGFDEGLNPGGNGAIGPNGGNGSYAGGTGGGGGATGGFNSGGGGGGFIGNGNTSTNGDANGDGGASFENGGTTESANFSADFSIDFRGGNAFGGGGGGGLFGGGGGGGYSGGGGGEAANGNPGGGGGGGSIVDSSATAILAEVSGANSPDDPFNGEIIITAVATPTPIRSVTINAAYVLSNGAFGFDVTGPSGSNVVILVSTDLKTWLPLQTNLLSSAPFHFSDTRSPANVQRFYRALLP